MALGLIPQGFAQGREGQKPNVLILLTDDQRLGDFSFTGNAVLNTPNMDRLASEADGFSCGADVYADARTAC